MKIIRLTRNYEPCFWTFLMYFCEIMTTPFHKYQGTGNDFIMIDNRDLNFHPKEEIVRKLCDRRFGVGADGLILLEGSSLKDFKMVYFNADGRESTFCGNGGRCVVAFAKSLGIIGDLTTFEAKDGLHEAGFTDGNVRLKMRNVHEIKLDLPGYELFTGSPHFIEFRENVAQINVAIEGRKIRNSPAYIQDGINVNFVEKRREGIYVRTFERGVEDETFSCGTGVTAAALIAGLYGYNSPVSIETPGGKLSVAFTLTEPHSFSDVYLIGPARYVFEGVIEI